MRKSSEIVSASMSTNSSHFGNLKIEDESEIDFANRFELEALEPRLLMTSMAATLSLDAHFGNAGLASANLPVRQSPLYWDDFAPIVPGPNGTIYAATRAWPSDNSSPVEIGLARFLSNGLPDPSFGLGGTVRITEPYSWITVGSVLSQADGKVMLVAEISQIQAQTQNRPVVESDLLILRFNADGSIDSHFGTDGVVSIPGFNESNPRSTNAWLVADGKIVVLYHQNEPLPVDGPGSYSRELPQALIMRRINSDGSLDTSFGVGGQQELKLNTGIKSVAIERLLGANPLPGGGFSVFVALNHRSDPNSTGLPMSMFQLQLDSSGTVVTEGQVFADNSDNSLYYISAECPDGKLLLLNYATGKLTRFTVNGQFDPNFGDGGVISVFDPESQLRYGVDFMVPQSDGKILLGVSNWRQLNEEETVGDGGLGRLNANGSPDLTFAGGQPAFSPIEYGTTALQLPDGSIIANSEDTSKGGVIPRLLRILSSGGLPDSYDMLTSQYLAAANTFLSGDPIYGAGFTTVANKLNVESVGLNLFESAPGSTPFNLHGNRKIFALAD